MSRDWLIDGRFSLTLAVLNTTFRSLLGPTSDSWNLIFPALQQATPFFTLTGVVLLPVKPQKGQSKLWTWSTWSVPIINYQTLWDGGLVRELRQGHTEGKCVLGAFISWRGLTSRWSSATKEWNLKSLSASDSEKLTFGKCTQDFLRDFSIHSADHKKRGVKKNWATEMSIRYVLLINKHCQTRLARHYRPYDKPERITMSSEILRSCLQRGTAAVPGFLTLRTDC